MPGFFINCRLRMKTLHTIL